MTTVQKPGDAGDKERELRFTRGAILLPDEGDEEQADVEPDEVVQAQRDLAQAEALCRRYSEDPSTGSLAQLADALRQKETARFALEAAKRRAAAREYQAALAKRDACESELARLIREHSQRQSELGQLDSGYHFGLLNQASITDEEIAERASFAGRYEAARLHQLRAYTKMDYAADAKHQAQEQVAKARKALDRVLNS
ncbi:MAG: hypothetical protein M1140_07490 [Chloroflexi bacterium]|nr:hypothetical protein [Chloroflexota bacterium]